MVRMQGQGMAGEQLPLCGGATQWSGGDKVSCGGSYKTPRAGRGVGLNGSAWLGRPLNGLLGEIESTELHAVLAPGGVGCLFGIGGHTEIH